MKDTYWGSFTPLQRCSWCILQPKLTRPYIYIYIYVCVCVCVCLYISGDLLVGTESKHYFKNHVHSIKNNLKSLLHLRLKYMKILRLVQNLNIALKSVCVYVCAYMCVYIYIYIYIYIYTCRYTCVCIYIYIYIYFVCVYIYIYIYIFVCVCVYACIYM